VNITALYDTMINSTIDSNTVGVKIYGEHGCISNCRLSYNGTGIFDSTNMLGINAPNTISHNYIEHNGIGMVTMVDSDLVQCNRFCNNTNYALKYMGTNNTSSFKSNYWCTADSASTEGLVYDGYDNVNYGLVSFMPIDSSCAHYTTCRASVSDSLYSTSPLNWNIAAYYSNEVTSATWNWGDGTTSTGLYPSHSYTAAGWYSICVTAYSSCGDSATHCTFDSLYKASSAMVNIQIVDGHALGISQAAFAYEMLVAPNPNNGLFTVYAGDKKLTADIYSMDGRKVFHQDIEGKTVVDGSTLPEGVYNLVISGAGAMTSKKIVILR
jgi:hypothetical protein